MVVVVGAVVGAVLKGRDSELSEELLIIGIVLGNLRGLRARRPAPHQNPHHKYQTQGDSL